MSTFDPALTIIKFSVARRNHIEPDVVRAALDGSPVTVTVKILSPPRKVKVEISP
jgi:hypothetical protein